MRKAVFPCLLLILALSISTSCTITPHPRPVQYVRPVVPATQTVVPAPSGDEREPKRFFLDFAEGYLVHEPSSGVLQVATEQMVLSYGSDMEMKQLKPYLYHFRLRSWKGFYWKINTSRKEAYKVTGTFGVMGGSESTIPGIKVDVVGGSDTQAPQRFLLRFTSFYLVHEPSSGTVQIPAEMMVLSYGQGWEVKQLKPYLYHLRLSTWKGFYWKVNTSRKEAYKVDGTFGAMGGSEKILNMSVRVVN